MELTDEIKDLLKAHDMACVSDFLDNEEEDIYLEETDLNLYDIKRLSEKYSGWGMGSLEGLIINKLKQLNK